MAPVEFVTKILEVVKAIKVPVVILLLTISIIQIGYASFVGSNDDRGIYSRIGTLFFIAALLFAGDKIILGLQALFGN